jgi:carbon monoxide dehydrogenase subunit G
MKSFTGMARVLSMSIKSGYCTRLIVAAAMALAVSMPIYAKNIDSADEIQKRLANGEVIVGLKKQGATGFVTGTILINAPPAKVWPIMVNPYEFMGRISPRMKRVEVVLDKPDCSVLKITLDMSILMPNFTYVVESSYKNCERITFERTAGLPKVFKGTWDISPIDGGKKTRLDYATYVDPGFFVPQWLIREGMKNELPHILKAFRDRVEEVADAKRPMEQHTILAASVEHKASTTY